ncbi:STY0301 family protein [Janthinobacterium fluminis]|uniref:STY0301 family protein n=1 Tax=Janthinobacterium fluminis TaxID=2987524 RepID=UPI003B43B142
MQSAAVAASALFCCIAFHLCDAVAAAPASVPLTCPASIPISSSPPKSGPQGWTVYVASELYLNSAAPIGGPPEMHADLADYTSKPGKKQWSYTYDLDREFSDGKWLECGYGTHNEITLSQRMPDSIKSCIFVYRKGGQGRTARHQNRLPLMFFG